MSKEIIKGNILIAQFMGLKRKYESTEEIFIDSVKYHSSWDWLMPVVEKIRDLGYRVEIILSTVDANVHLTKIGGDTAKDRLNIVAYKNPLEAVWLAVVEFIKWYNLNKPSWVKKKILSQLYNSYGTDSGILFGIQDRLIVKQIVDFTVDKISKPSKEDKP